MDQFARNFADDPDVHFPIAYPEFSSKRVLTMERLDGYSIARRDRMLADGIDITAFAELFANTMLSMVFRDGFYHADPHPGNIFVLPGGRLGMLDSGKIGRVDEKTQDDFINIVTAFINSDVDSLTDELVRMCETPATFQPQHLSRRCRRVCGRVCRRAGWSRPGPRLHVHVWHHSQAQAGRPRARQHAAVGHRPDRRHRTLS